MSRKYGRQTGQDREMGSSLSERDMLQDMLLTEKYLSGVLNDAILESSSAQIRQMFTSMQDNAQDHAQMIYEEMSNQGWYNAGETGAGRNVYHQQSQRYRTAGAAQHMQGYGYAHPRGRSYRHQDTWQKTF